MDTSEVDRLVVDTAHAWLELPAERLARCDVSEDAAMWVALATESDQLADEILRIFGSLPAGWRRGVGQSRSSSSESRTRNESGS